MTLFFYENAAECPVRKTGDECSRDDALFFSTGAHGLVIFLHPSAMHFRKDIITIQCISVLSMWSAVEIVKPRPVGGVIHFEYCKLSDS